MAKAGWQQGRSRTEGQNQNQTWQNATGRSRTETSGESFSRGSSETVGQAETTSASSTINRGSSRARTESQGVTITITTSTDGEIQAIVEGQYEGHAKTVGESQSRSEARGTARTNSRSRGESTIETTAQSLATTNSSSQSRGGSTGRTTSSSESKAQSQSRTHGDSRQQSQSRSQSSSQSRGNSEEQGQSFSRLVTDQPGVRHTPFWEERPEFWSLEEQRWRAAEILMNQPVGHCLIKTASGELGMARIPEPKKFYILPQVLVRFTRELYERHCLTKDQAERLLAARQAELSRRINRAPIVPDNPQAASEPADGVSLGRAKADSPPPRDGSERPVSPVGSRTVPRAI
ncbi:MAG TPA: hypothetical protein VKU19_07440 [Bryobacteraceae bacterium]|nr:hypothetical protein [Bryobacteraceae bacterium]